MIYHIIKFFGYKEIKAEEVIRYQSLFTLSKWPFKQRKSINSIKGPQPRHQNQIILTRESFQKSDGVDIMEK